MKTYSVEVKKKAQKELEALPTQATERIIGALRSLATNPRPEGCKKLKGQDMLWRIRVGNYRIIYSIEDFVKVVAVLRITHRKDAY